MKRLSRSNIILLGIPYFNITSRINTPAKYLVLYPLGNGIKIAYFVSRSTTTIMYSYITLSKLGDYRRGPIKSIEITFYNPSGALLGWRSL